MRRKSTRNAQKATPEKIVKESEPSPKTRRSRRRKRTPSKSSESEDEVTTVTKPSQPEETPDTTTTSHTPTDEETSEEPVWKVTSTEGQAPKGEVQKLKICLKRPAPDSPDKNKTRRSKSSSQTEDDTLSSEEKPVRRTRSRGSPVVRHDGLSSQEGDEDVEEKKGKGKSKGKHKSKIEKSPQLSEPELQTNNEISENVQVTPQSPTIDKPVDNENDYNKVDGVQNVNENIQRREIVNEEPANKPAHDSDNEQDNSANNAQSKDSDDDQPLSAIQKATGEKPQSPVSETVSQITSDVQQEDSESYQETSKQDSVFAEDQKSQDLSIDEKHAQTSTEDKKFVKTSAEEEKYAKASTEDEKHVEAPIEDEEHVKASTEGEQHVKESTKDEKHVKTVTENEKQDKTESITEVSSIKESEVAGVEENVMEKPSEEKSPEKITEENSPEKITEEIPEQVAAPKDEIPKKSEETATIEDSEKDVKENIEMNHSSVSQDNPPEAAAEHETIANQPKESKESVSSVEKPIKERRKFVSRSPRHWLKRDNDYLKKDAKEKDRTDETSTIKPAKMNRKWEMSLDLTTELVKIDLESIQVVWPTTEFPKEPDLNLEIEKERRRSVTESAGKKLERKVSVEYKYDFSERPSFEKQSSVSSTTQDSEDSSNIIAFNRKISIVDDTASKLKPPPSPAKNPISNILYITNLVRPFTVKQLKELLERTGKIQEDGFWTDRIKSKCYVQYESQEEAEATRNALHGVQWPIGNGKKLIIDYATEEDMNTAKNPPIPPAVPVQDTKTVAKEVLEPVENKPRIEEKSTQEMEKKRVEGPIREWDIGKKEFRRDRSRSRERSRKHKRSRSPSEDFMSRKQRKEEESVPQKLMDDLFLKTRATPSIYWQPLSPEEIAMKQQQRLMRMEEHKRRMEENSRLKGREIGRGAFRRRYD